MTSISVNTRGAERLLNDVQKKQIPFAVSKTLNQLAYQASRKELPKKSGETFDGGATRWTKSAFKYRKSSKKKLYADVYVNLDTHPYLEYQIEGGTRHPFKKKILVPTKNIKTNKFGNLTKGQRNKLFTDKKKYFQGIPNGKTSTAFLGVWERKKTKKSGSTLKMVAKYADKAVYTKKLPFHKIIKSVVRDKTKGFNPLFMKNLNFALKTARR